MEVRGAEEQLLEVVDVFEFHDSAVAILHADGDVGELWCADFEGVRAGHFELEFLDAREVEVDDLGGGREAEAENLEVL